jgi:pentatricopeptide repeat protein
MGSIEKAEKLFYRMQGERVKPDAVMFATLIKGQLKEGRFNQALDMAIRMVEERPSCSSRHNPYHEVYQKF